MTRYLLLFAASVLIVTGSWFGGIAGWALIFLFATFGGAGFLLGIVATLRVWEISRQITWPRRPELPTWDPRGGLFGRW